ncbi:MAG TPA: chromosomal replication initiator protein DnaA [Candidatus Saccharimonadales bacterium]|nr:chromosomal replication initiator protein DnaA [Candidatus Saccharimonadales bacterium]
MDKKELWNSVLAELQLTISSANFQTWFRGKTEIVELQVPLVVVGCSSPYVRDWLEQRYLGQIKGVVDRLIDQSTSITFVVSPSLNVPATKTTSSKTAEETETLFVKEDLGKLSEKLTTAKLSPGYTFSNFVVGGSNQLAYAVATAAAEDPGKAYNPILFYGGVGLGKTHLMQSVGNEVARKNSKAKILYATSEDFTNDLMEAIQTKRTRDFRDKYRSLDVLLLDDVQFIAGRESTQEEFFHTFNALYSSHKQIILTSDREPSEIAKLESRLRSRFSGGMIADIQPPDTDMREAILESKIKRLNIDIPSEVVHYLAGSVGTNVRELEGSLTHLATVAKVRQTDLSLELAKSFVDQRKSRALASRVEPKEVLEIVSDYFNVKQSEIKGSSRVAKIVLPRQITMYLLRTDLGIQYENIAQYLGGRDHSTVMHGVEKIGKSVESSDKFRGLVADIRAKLYN